MQCPKCHVTLEDEDDGPYICCADAPMQWQCGEVRQGQRRLCLSVRMLPAVRRQTGPARCGDRCRRVDMAALDAVRMAFEIELGGRAFYQRAAAESSDDELRALFGRFAVMEGEHMETLSRRYHIEPPHPSPDFRVELAAIFAGVRTPAAGSRQPVPDRDRAGEEGRRLSLRRAPQRRPRVRPSSACTSNSAPRSGTMPRCSPPNTSAGARASRACSAMRWWKPPAPPVTPRHWKSRSTPRHCCWRRSNRRTSRSFAATSN